jgi:hypothetical protein
MTNSGALLLLVAVLAQLHSPQSVHTPAGKGPAIKPSQHGTVAQQVAGTLITVVYNRPVARGRDLFGALVPYDKVWCPGADYCTTIKVSTDVTIEGRALPAGTYSLWAKPGATKWTLMVNRAQLIFHTSYQSVASDDILTLEVTPRSGSHMETLAFYFPVVDGKHAELVLHWGTVVVPLSIDVP